ncbi:fructosamine kinase family protein [Pedobacter sp. SYSU D00535]|uniref:fructosamine kinase family protein n=1 Tax=Pedobacter sp. SYSU D00535 TaxID=2810308 RepID=UPI001A9734A8
MTEDLVKGLGEILSAKFGRQNQLRVLRPVSGGSINQAYQIEFARELFFLKLNNERRFPNMFIAEAEGLRRIGEAVPGSVPKVVAVGVIKEHQYLILDWVESGNCTNKSQQALGRDLALLHKSTGEMFGLDHDNYMGSLPQYNTKCSSWSDFFISQRLKPQLDQFRAKRLLVNYKKEFESLFDRLKNLVPIEVPSLVHGDLWGGNFISGQDDKSFLVDPAIAYAHREVDIAMTTLFGGFTSGFYDAYQEVYPLHPGWRSRLDLWNLYPVLVHVNLFGSTYLAKLEQCLKRFL